MSKLSGIAIVVSLAANTALAQKYYPTENFGGPVVTGQVGGEVYGGGQVVGGDVPWGEDYGSGPQGLGYPGIISNGGGEQLYPYDQQDPWQHGYFQEIPAYGGYAHFRPYNYRHVLAQTQAAAGWGLSRTMPYSHQYWQHYHERAALQHCPLPYHAYDQYEAEQTGHRVPARTATAPGTQRRN